jgi:transposase
MPHSLSTDLLLRVVTFIDEGHSRHEAAARFKMSVSFAVNLMTLWKEAGSVKPKPFGGFTHGKAEPRDLRHLSRDPIGPANGKRRCRHSRKPCSS